MKSGKAVGPDDIPVEVWKCLGEAAVEFLASLFNRVLESERMPEEWRRSVLVPIFKNKGDVQSCSNYRGIKLMSHTMKVWERVVEARLRKVVEICEQQYGFMPRKSTTDAIFALRILMEKYRDGQKELHCVFVDLEKAYDRVPREELWYCMRKSGVAEKYVRVVQDMYERSRTVVRCAVGQTEEFNVEVGLHQGSALSPFLFAIVMDQLSEEVRQESPWTMMFADDIVICSESREQVEENLERWRFALERRGMKVSRSKTEYMCVNEREGSGTVRLQGEEVKKVQEFKYLGSTVQSNGECGKEVKKRVQAGWNGWRKVSGVLCDQKISARIKGKVYRTVVRPAMLYGLETVSLRKRQESELEVAELKMLRLCNCDITDEGCVALAAALRPESHLKELDLKDNDLGEQGVKLLTDIKEHGKYTLEKLILGDCDLTEKSCAVLASVLSSDSTHLTELRLSRNKLQDSGVKHLSEALQSSNCKLKTLRLNTCSITEEGFTALISALRMNPSHLRVLDLGRNKAGQTGLDLLCDLLKEQSCKLEKLKLFDCGITQEGSTHLISALISNPSHLRELDLGWNKIRDPGMRLISDLLRNELCKLEILKLHDCNITLEGCVALAAALSSKSHLKELDLSSNDLGDEGYKLLSDIKEDEKYTLDKLEKSLANQIPSMNITELQPVWKQKFKSRLQKKFQMINEGIPTHGNSRLLNEVFTELYITSDCGCGHISDEHEVRHIEKACRSLILEESINYNDIFKPLPGDEKPIRTVLTEGIAGIGKTVSVQKFVLDWAEGKANQDLDFIFPFNFRELNFKKGEHLSLLELLHFFFPEIIQLKIDYHHYKIMFIFDGLDESRISFDFLSSKMLSDVTESAPIDVLLTNLINGNLLPSAFLWITSRPAASSQIPDVYINRVTEVRGFNDPEKDEYFQKRISDQTLADKIITHLKSSRSLHIMCHIPVFCWISATVLEGMFSVAETGEVPKTLTQMFTHFLILQIKHRAQKYKKQEMNPGQIADIVLKLGKLAFQQLENGNLIFYEDDIIECGIDVQEATVYSGVCTRIFIEEVTSLGKVYSFVHLSVQEHLAAMYAFLSCINGNLSKQQTPGIFGLSSKATLLDLLKTAVDKALQSKNGHLDLFLRFLMGLSMESNSILLQDLLTETGRSSLSKDAAVTIKEIAAYIKEKIRRNPSMCKTINLFHCLNELNDQSLVQEVQGFLTKREDHCLQGVKLSPVQWSAVVFLLLNSEEKLEEFNLKKYAASDECLMNMHLVITAFRKALELDLSDNKLQDSGAKLLAMGLKSPQCKLEILRLGDCDLTEKSCAVLASVLVSESTHLTELCLSRNKLQDSGVKHLSEALQSSNCKLKTLRLNTCSITEEGFTALISALRMNPSHLRVLDLGRNKAGQTGLDLLCDLLKEQSCKLEKLKLFDCGITQEGSTHLISALISNPSYLRELDLGWNKIRDPGMRLISDLLRNELCKLEILKLHDCNITLEGCVALAAALSSKSHLKELDLSSNDLGDEGYKLLSDIKEDEKYTLDKLESAFIIEVRRFKRTYHYNTKMSLPVKDKRYQKAGSGSPEPSSVSMKSDGSMGMPINFQQAEKERYEKERSVSSEPSGVSMKSDQSMGMPISFGQSQKESDKAGISDPSAGKETKLQHLTRDKELQSSTRELDPACLKSRLQKKFQMINEGIPTHGKSRLLNEVYTELYITSDCGCGHISDEHEVRRIERTCRSLILEESINYNDIFKPLPGDEKPIRTVLTEGVAGIGKTVCVQKFVLDWAEGKANQDLDFIFPFNFRELNFKKGEHLSLLELLHFFFPEIIQLKIDYHHYKIMFIFDGLDESRISFDFLSSKMLSDVTESAPIDVLLTNLINGNLLPSAFLWITSRPAASSQIPDVYINRVTEVRGFNDPEKDEYFQKRISDQTLADKIITHLKSSRSLHIMCHIPVFCWISATVLEGMFSAAETGEVPKTLTQMFTHFLILQIKHRAQKYKKQEMNPGQIADIVLKLGKLAFQQLENGNLIFYEDDIIECGIDVQEATVYSGVCTQGLY
ncbi:hypothetical protein QTP70_012837 [Hemibagrus guttatus]|uniref:ribonuclease H n=1 Tax=Hemibagrus guttatus TaxID=175788 RepID=A0AAE0RAZ6_9TELE|nr:hypothetical protein QTP70_012837 [Hemibagrus guttatus]